MTRRKETHHSSRDNNFLGSLESIGETGSLYLNTGCSGAIEQNLLRDCVFVNSETSRIERCGQKRRFGRVLDLRVWVDCDGKVPISVHSTAAEPWLGRKVESFESSDQAGVHGLIVVAICYVKWSARAISGWIVGNAGIDAHFGLVRWGEFDALLEVGKDIIPSPTLVSYSIGPSLIEALGSSG